MKKEYSQPRFWKITDKKLIKNVLKPLFVIRAFWEIFVHRDAIASAIQKDAEHRRNIVKILQGK